MVLLKKSQSSDIMEYAPIAKALSTLDASSEQRLKRKFEIAYLLCEQNIAFLKMAPICELEEKHMASILGLATKMTKLVLLLWST